MLPAPRRLAAHNSANTPLKATMMGYRSGSINRPSFPSGFVLVFSLLITLLMTGCGTQGESNSDAIAAPPADVPAAPGNPLSQAPLPPQVEDERQLVIWVPENFSMGDESVGAQVIDDAITQFTQSYPGLQVEVTLKSQSGPASMLNYLRNAQKAAPSILPDVVAMDTQELWQIVDLGLVEPITDTVVGDLAEYYPFALPSVTYEDQIYGIPYAADLLHLAYRLDEEQDVPQSWEALSENEDIRYLFQGASREGAINESLLLHYVAAGGELNAAGEPEDPAALIRLLEFYETGVASGLIPEQNLVLSSPDAVWNAFITTDDNLADAMSHSFLDQRELVTDVHFASVPSYNGRPVALARTWAFAILTTDAERVDQAQDLINSLLMPSVHGKWAQFARLIPVSREAVDYWGTSQSYHNFLSILMDGSTVALPNGRVFAEFARRLQKAQQDILAGKQTVPQLVDEVIVTP